ncbi:MAG: response regulator transcription factor [Bacillota bacterium]|nr:response regulator transcription factor [Bacillota bacterium]
MKYRIVIADDHKLIREGIKKLLELSEEFMIVGEASNGNEAVELSKVLKPDLMILDINMPIMSGLDALKKIREEKCNMKVILLTIDDDKKSLINALELGADGYILKDSDPSKMSSILLNILDDETYIDKRLVKFLVDIYKHSNEDKKSKFCDLTSREKEVLYYLSSGYTNNEISKEIFISEKTVKNYVTSIYSKIGVNNRVKATLFAIENDIEKYIEE